MRKSVSMYDAWCDGSYRAAQRCGGAGWVIRHDGALTEGSTALPRLDKHARLHGSDIAEVTAVVGALSVIPRGAHIQLRLDCQNLIDWLHAGRLANVKKAQIGTLSALFDQAHTLMQSMENVQIIKISGANNPHHGRAHILSRTAATRLKP